MPSADTRFKPGVSGNPRGMPKKDNPLKKLCKAATAESFKQILHIAQSGEEESNRLKASQWIAEYAHGKARQEIEAMGPGGSPLLTAVLEVITKEAK